MKEDIKEILNRPLPKKFLTINLNEAIAFRILEKLDCYGSDNFGLHIEQFIELQDRTAKKRKWQLINLMNKYTKTKATLKTYKQYGLLLVLFQVATFALNAFVLFQVMGG